MRKNKMIGPFTKTLPVRGGKNRHKCCAYDWQNAIMSDNFILMQSTGLLDRNGKEIFEGDRCVAGDWTFEVIWDPNHAGFFPFYDSNPFDVPVDLKRRIIIGNIYENKPHAP